MPKNNSYEIHLGCIASPENASNASNTGNAETAKETEIPDEDAEKITTVQQAIDYVTARRKA